MCRIDDVMRQKKGFLLEVRQRLSDPGQLALNFRPNYLDIISGA